MGKAENVSHLSGTGIHQTEQPLVTNSHYGHTGVCRLTLSTQPPQSSPKMEDSSPTLLIPLSICRSYIPGWFRILHNSREAGSHGGEAAEALVTGEG